MKMEKIVKQNEGKKSKEKIGLKYKMRTKQTETPPCQGETWVRVFPVTENQLLELEAAKM